jgi:hypothetical protein
VPRKTLVSLTTRAAALVHCIAVSIEHRIDCKQTPTYIQVSNRFLWVIRGFRAAFGSHTVGHAQI